MKSSTLKRRVVITGIGLRTPLGNSPSTFFENLISGQSGLKKHPTLDLDCEVGCVDFDPDVHFTKLQQRFMDKVSQFAVVAARDAVSAAGLEKPLGESAGVYVGTSMGSMTAVEYYYDRYYKKLRANLVVPTVMPNGPSSQVAISLGIQGECQTYSSACASSAVAIGEAFRRVRDGYIDYAVAGGTECGLLPGILAAWHVMGVMYKEGAYPVGTGCRPFSKDRSGFAMGEGSAMFVLETLENATLRGVKPICELVGYGLSSDATHIVIPDHHGEVLAMKRALADGGIEAREVDYINAHGTGTIVGDAVEAKAIKAVFGEGANDIPVTSTKSAHGHLLGATAAVELAASVLALQHQILPPTTHWQIEDPECMFDCVPGVGRPVSGLSYAMSNSFGFGGCNAVLLAKACH